MSHRLSVTNKDAKNILAIVPPRMYLEAGRMRQTRTNDTDLVFRIWDRM
jgi:hypothetical protein